MAGEEAAMRLSIETRTHENMGDHAALVTRSHVQVEGETLEALVRRVFPALSSGYQTHDCGAELVIRVQMEADGKPSGQAASSYVAPF